MDMNQFNKAEQAHLQQVLERKQVRSVERRSAETRRSAARR
jgi:hypothetical protein